MITTESSKTTDNIFTLLIDVIEGLKEEVNNLKLKEAEHLFKRDMQELKNINPDLTSLSQLGDEFLNLRFTVNPLSGENYSVADIYSYLKGEKPEEIPSTGKLKSQTPTDDYFTFAEASSMSPANVKNNLAKIRNSMKKW